MSPGQATQGDVDPLARVVATKDSDDLGPRQYNDHPLTVAGSGSLNRSLTLTLPLKTLKSQTTNHDLDNDTDDVE